MLSAASDTIPNEFRLHSQAGAIVGNPLFNDFDYSTNSDMLNLGITSEEVEFSGSLDTASGAASENTEINLSFNSFDHNTANDIFDLGKPDKISRHIPPFHHPAQQQASPPLNSI